MWPGYRWPMEPPIEYTEASDGVRIAWMATGTGPTLVALPGVPFGDFAAEWRIPVLRRAYLGLADTLRVVQFDTRGSGHSQRDVEDLSFDAMLLDLEAVLDAAGVDRCVLLGFYHSCLHAVAFAARHPERVRGLVLFGGSLRGWDAMSGPGTQALLSLIDRDWGTFVESIAHAWLGWPAGEEGRLAADWFRNATTPEVARRVFRDASAVDVSADAANVAVDALVLHRRDAPVIPLEVSEALAAALPRGILRVLDGTSASLFFERTEETTRNPPRCDDRRRRRSLSWSVSADRAHSHAARTRGPSPRRDGRVERRDRGDPRPVDQHGRTPRRQRLPEDRRSGPGRRDRLRHPPRPRLTGFRDGGVTVARDALPVEPRPS